MSEDTLADHLNSIRYFWEEKGDVERYCYWEKIQPLLQEKRPDIVKAWKEYKAAEKILTLAVRNEDEGE